MKYPYIYTWGNNPKRATLKGKHCRILARGKMNSVAVQFEDGSLEIISRNALRKIPPDPEPYEGTFKSQYMLNPVDEPKEPTRD